MFFAADDDASTFDGKTDVKLAPCLGDNESIQSVAKFMIDAFWLQSPHHLIQSGGLAITTEVSDSARAALMQEQSRDLMDKYGERLGKRLLDSCLLTALDEDSSEMLGVVGIDMCLINKATNEIIIANKAETMLKNAVSSLGPKQRRQYKDSSAQDLASELLPPGICAICCLSNLAVSPKARRRGIAKKLCAKAEKWVSYWGYDEMFLKVESENTAARYLYEQKLGYATECTLDRAVALRVDVDSGCFVETNADTLILSKRL
jgi:GNAT superfamily N-acetyltransferase